MLCHIYGYCSKNVGELVLLELQSDRSSTNIFSPPNHWGIKSLGWEWSSVTASPEFLACLLLVGLSLIPCRLRLTWIRSIDSVTESFVHRPCARQFSETWKRCWRLPNRYLRHHPLQYDYLLSKFIWLRLWSVVSGIWPSSSTSNVNQLLLIGNRHDLVGSTVIELLFQNDELLFLTKIPPWSRDWGTHRRRIPAEMFSGVVGSPLGTGPARLNEFWVSHLNSVE